MEIKQIAVKGRDGEVRTLALPGAENEAGLETVRRIAVRTRGGQLVTLGIPGEYVRNARTVQGVAGADILSGETVYGEANRLEFLDENGNGICSGSMSVLTSDDEKTDVVTEGFYIYIYRWKNGKRVLIGKVATQGRVSALSKDGSLLTVEHMWEEPCWWGIYSIGEDVTLLSVLPNAAAGGTFGGGLFSRDGSIYLHLGVSSDEKTLIRIYSVGETGFSYVGDFQPTENKFWGFAFSQDGGMLVGYGLGNGSAGRKFLMSGTTITEGEILYGEGTIETDTGSSVCFSPDGDLMLLGGSHGRVYVYSVEGTTLTRLPEKDIWVCEEARQKEINKIVFSPDGKLLMLSGRFPGGVKIYSVEGSDFTLLGSVFGEAQVNATGGLSGEGMVVYSQKIDYPSERTKCFLIREGELIPEESAVLYPALEGKIPKGDYLVGFAKDSMEKGETGAARIIGEVEE